MDPEIFGVAALAGVGTYVASRAVRNERFRHTVGAGLRAGEKVLAFSAATTLKAGAAVAAGAGTAAAHSGSGLLRLAKLIDRAAT